MTNKLHDTFKTVTMVIICIGGGYTIHQYDSENMLLTIAGLSIFIWGILTPLNILPITRIVLSLLCALVANPVMESYNMYGDIIADVNRIGRMYLKIRVVCAIITKMLKVYNAY